MVDLSTSQGDRRPISWVDRLLMSWAGRHRMFWGDLLRTSWVGRLPISDAPVGRYYQQWASVVRGAQGRPRNRRK
jgi:hypothetical protein